MSAQFARLLPHAGSFHNDALIQGSDFWALKSAQFFAVLNLDRSYFACLHVMLQARETKMWHVTTWAGMQHLAAAGCFAIVRNATLRIWE